MDNQNQENLKELFTRFYDAEQAESCVEDLCTGERIFDVHAAPEPDARLIASIKANIASSLSQRKAKRFRRRLYEAAGVAAAIVVLAITSVQLLDKSDLPLGKEVYTASLLPTVIWESDDIAADDADLAVFTAEVDQIEYEIHTLQSGEESIESEGTLTELEMELAEINDEFWKG